MRGVGAPDRGSAGPRTPAEDIVCVVKATRVGRSLLFRGPDQAAAGTPGGFGLFRQDAAASRSP
jgi:hypothetical protein